MGNSQVQTVPEPTRPDPARRAVIVSAGVLGASALLAGCGYDTSQLRDKYTSGDAQAAGAGAPDAGAPVGAAPAGNGAAPAGSAPDGGAQGGGAQGGGAQGGGAQGGGAANPDALAATGDIPVGGGRFFPDDKVVVTQPVAGTFKAFDTTCSHAGCAVTKISNGTINCPCHGAKFSVEDGSVRGGPAPSPLQEVAIKIDGDSIQIA